MEIVHGLTDSDEIKDLPLDERKFKQSIRVKSESESIRRIKLCDQISNIRCVVSDPPIQWIPEKNRMYAIGAKQIADECKGISPALDAAFLKEYEKAVQQFGIV